MTQRSSICFWLGWSPGFDSQRVYPSLGTWQNSWNQFWPKMWGSAFSFPTWSQAPGQIILLWKGEIPQNLTLTLAWTQWEVVLKSEELSQATCSYWQTLEDPGVSLEDCSSTQTAALERRPTSDIPGIKSEIEFQTERIKCLLHSTPAI